MFLGLYTYTSEWWAQRLDNEVNQERVEGLAATAVTAATVVTVAIADTAAIAATAATDLAMKQIRRKWKDSVEI